MSLSYRVLLVIGLAGLLSSVSMRAADAAEFKQENTAENLKAFLQHFQSQIHREKNPTAAAAIFKELLPDEARLEKMMKPETDAATRAKIVAFYKQLKDAAPTGEQIKGMLKAKQTEVLLYAATTEELIAMEKGSIPYKHFPNSAREFAKTVFRPKMTFYEAEFVELGKDSGREAHLIYWDGTQWTMLGPLYASLRQKKKE